VAAWAVCAACSSDSGQPGGPGPKTDAAGSDTSADAIGPGGDDGESSGDGSTKPPSDGGFPPPSDAQVSPATDAPMDDPTCSPNTKYGTPVAVPGVPSFASQPLVTMTNDELTIAWVVDAGNGLGNVFVADRGSANASFGTAVALPSSSTGSSYLDGDATVMDGGNTYFAFDRVALSADGLRLIGVAVGNHAMAQFVRVDRTGVFTSTPAEGPFVTLAQTLMPGELLGDPVLGADSQDLVYSKYGASPTLSVYESVLTGQNWPTGFGQVTTALEEANGHRKRPTSMTGDRRTLFVWDEAGEAYGVLRQTTGSQFNYAIPFGNLFSIQVNTDCSRLYFVASSGSGFVLEEESAL
jgi:hypothetical protein